jgi:y4mF family transcriptional regulator
MSDTPTALLADFVRSRRRYLKLSQLKLAQVSGVGLRFVRELEQGKATLQLDKVDQVLRVFGYQVGAVPVPRPAADDSPEGSNAVGVATPSFDKEPLQGSL